MFTTCLEVCELASIPLYSVMIINLLACSSSAQEIRVSPWIEEQI